MNKFLYLNFAIPIVMHFGLLLIKIIVTPGIYSLILGSVIWFILPCLLLIINSILIFCRIQTSLLKCSFFMLLGLLLGEITWYLVWVISVKRLFNPDGETLELMKEVAIYYFCFALAFLLIGKSMQFLFQLLHKKP